MPAKNECFSLKFNWNIWRNLAFKIFIIATRKFSKICNLVHFNISNPAAWRGGSGAKMRCAVAQSNKSLNMDKVYEQNAHWIDSLAPLIRQNRTKYCERSKFVVYVLFLKIFNINRKFSEIFFVFKLF